MRVIFAGGGVVFPDCMKPSGGRVSVSEEFSVMIEKSIIGHSMRPLVSNTNTIRTIRSFHATGKVLQLIKDGRAFIDTAHMANAGLDFALSAD